MLKLIMKQSMRLRLRLIEDKVKFEATATLKERKDTRMLPYALKDTQGRRGRTLYALLGSLSGQMPSASRFLRILMKTFSIAT